MKRMRFFIFGLVSLAALSALWLWWHQPRRVDMSAYIPADTLIYLELNDIPALLSAITQTEAWQLASQPAGLPGEFGEYGWLARFASLTGIGPAEKVALLRSQVAVAVLGAHLGSADDSLKLKPQYAIVVETHTSRFRIGPVVEEKLGAFAKKAYGAPRFERREESGISWLIWHSPDNQRSILAAISGSVVITGPTEAVVRACLDTQRNTRPNLVNNPGLNDMRSRLDAAHSLAFGYITPEGLGQIVKLAATAYAAPLVLSDQRLGGAIDALLPTVPPKITEGLGWSARLTNGAVEDRYLLALKNSLAENLRDPLAARANFNEFAAKHLPDNTASVTFYNFKSASAAWEGVNKSLAGQLDIVGAVLTSRLLAAAWQPYGIDDPARFLGLFNERLATAKLDQENGGTILLHERNPEFLPDEGKRLKLQIEWLNRWLGPAPAKDYAGIPKMQLSQDHERAAMGTDFFAAFGPPEQLLQFTESRNSGRNLAQRPGFKHALQSLNSDNTALVITFSDEQASALDFIKLISPQPNPRQNEALGKAIRDLPFAVSQTRLQGDALEKRTHSSFGLLGTIAIQFGK